MKRIVRYQQGSAHMIIIAVLVVALSATLGVLFYQNFIARPQPAPITSPIANETSEPLTKQVAFDSQIYELTYPANGWTASTKPIEGSREGGSVTYFETVDSTVKVTFSVSEAGMGGTCNVNDKRRIGYYRVDTDDLNTTLTGEPLYMTEVIFDGEKDGYRYLIGLTPDSGATHAEVGQSPCNVAYIGVVSQAVRKGDTLTSPSIVAQIAFPKLDGATIAEMQPVKDMLATKEFKEATAILKSARKK